MRAPAIALAFAALCGCAGRELAPLTQNVAAFRARPPKQTGAAKVYVVSHGAFGVPNNPSVAEFPATGNGNIGPKPRIAGKATQLAQIQYVGVDASGTIYVSNQNGGGSSGSVSEYAASAKGDAAPIATVSGLRTPEGVALDASGNLYVATIDSLLVFAPGANGNATPLRDVTGSNTLLANPYQVFVDANGKTYVAEQNAIYTFAPGATGNVAPLQNIQGAATFLNDTLGVAADSSGQIYATNLDANDVAVFGPTDTGDVAPRFVVQSSAFDEPWGIFVDAEDNVYVANRGNNSIAVFTAAGFPGGTPSAIIAGSKTALDNPIGVAVR